MNTPTREHIAEAIYNAMPYDGAGPAEKPAWIDGGNSFKQDEARKYADIALRSFITQDREPVGYLNRVGFDFITGAPRRPFIGREPRQAFITNMISPDGIAVYAHPVPQPSNVEGEAFWQLSCKETSDWLITLSAVQSFLTILNPSEFQETLAMIERLMKYDAAALSELAPKIIRLTRHIAHPSLNALRGLYAIKIASQPNPLTPGEVSKYGFTPGPATLRKGTEARIYAVNCHLGHIHAAYKTSGGEWSNKTFGEKGKWGPSNKDNADDLMPNAALSHQEK